ncbi:BamA/TamA family outer membrane protein [Glacieibacterium sp.]|uniref:autotransporter assembly complex protein TamA n=1 Tax=Glacieibacterium sp. TaxID=2860237 RepID=UPI003AFF6E7A
MRGFVSSRCGRCLLAVPALLAWYAPAVAQPLSEQELQAQLPSLTPSPATAEPASPPAIVPDPALGTPLVPLAGAAAETPPAISTTDAPAPDIRYRVTLEGLAKVGLEARFKALSALLSKGRKAGNAAQVSARADEDKALAERLLRSEGYFDAVASTVVGPVPDKDGQLPVALTATPGPRYALGSITITGAAPEPRGFALEALELKTGDPIVAADVEGGEARIALRLPERGYPFVVVGQRDILLDGATHVGDYTLPLTPGRKARFGGFRIAGDEVFDARHIALLPRFKAGQIYDSRQLDDLRQALVGTSLLSGVAVRPVATGVVAEDGTEVVDLEVNQTKGPWRVLAGGLGYGTGEGFKATGSWTHRNLFPPEGALTVSAVAGTQEQSVNAQFRRSNAGQRDRAFQIGTSVARQRFDAYNAETFNLNSSLSRSSTPTWQKRWTWSLGGELIASRETAFDAARADRDRGTYFIAALPLQLGYDRSNSLLDPTKGFRLTARVSPEAQKRTSGGFQSYGRGLFEASGYFPISDAFVLAGRARLGSIVGAPRDDIAPSRRLYAGGGGSVRGFGYQQLGPRDADNNPLGGRSLTEFGAEVRYRFGNFGVVPFLDAGRVGEKSMPSISGMRYGAGIGGRYYTNFGPMRVDIATPLGRRPGEARVALYISIGQAF